jgi:HD-GYP domain-containing protein (c-di-GMP phosphodiesterase class II)
MIRVDLSNVAVGTKLAKPIYNERGAVWLKAGAELNERYLTLLRMRGVSAVFVDEPAAADVVVREALSEGTRGDATVALADVVADLSPAMEESVTGDPRDLARWLETSAGRRLVRDSIAPSKVQAAANRLVDDVMAASFQSALVSPKDRDGYVLSHAVDVAAIAVTIGKLLHLPRHSLINLARGCLLMDVGLAMIDPKILNKPGPLDASERYVIQTHPNLGYELLKAFQPSEILANTIALQHHERQDGRGYPRGLRGTNRIHLSAFDRDRGEICLLAEIAAVADVYDALSSNRPQRAALQPEQVVATLHRIGGTHLNRSIVEEFLKSVPVYPVGLAVYVYGPNFGPYRGVIVKVHRHRLDRPIVRIFQNGRGADVPPFEVDLADAPRLHIRTVPTAASAAA